MRVLVVEDEPGLNRALVDLLEGASHTVEAVTDGRVAVARGAEGSFDLVLLDLMLPGLDGIEVCRQLKMRRPALYIIMLTARGSEDDKVKGLTTGADDYVTKPFGARELLARLEAVARRIQSDQPRNEILNADGCRIDLGRCRATRKGKTVSLTAREAGILRVLHHHRARAVTRAELLEQVWGSPGDLLTRTVDMTIANLRQKIERNPAEPKIVATVKGIGYAWGEG
jgi:two-component system alkaline phosphatase synthesis response regulator PhoP